MQYMTIEKWEDCALDLTLVWKSGEESAPCRYGEKHTMNVILQSDAIHHLSVSL